MDESLSGLSGILSLSSLYMSLVFAAITPHPPILIPAIGKEQIEKLAETKKAMEQLEQDLYIAHPHVIVVISPHGSLYPDAFTVNAHTHFVSAFEQFGDLATKKVWNGSPNLAADISHETRERKLLAQLVSQESVDHGTSVPMFYLANHLPDTTILPIGYSDLPTEAHLQFGELLKDIIMGHDKRVAVIASADLSHRLSPDAPSGFHANGKVFDETMMELLAARNVDGVAALNPALVKDAGECGYRAILILLGIIKNMDAAFKQYAYEAPFGVGYLTGNFVL